MIRPEQALHLSAAHYLRVAITSPAWWSTIGHGSHISRTEAGLLKAKGLRRGLPDIMVFSPGDRRPDCCRARAKIFPRAPE